MVGLIIATSVLATALVAVTTVGAIKMHKINKNMTEAFMKINDIDEGLLEVFIDDENIILKKFRKKCYNKFRRWR